ncbi:MAG TPA: hypothetical protein VGB85_14530 [Nannocystis sp.]|jgi:hypothetical protein
MPRSSPIATLALLAGACFYDLAPKTGATTDASSETTATTSAPTTTSADPTTTSDITTTTGSTSGSSDTGGSTTSGADETTLETTGADLNLYGPCDMNAQCPSGQQCLSIMETPGSFCSPACVGMGCPAAPPGVTAEPACVLTEARGREPVSCALVCDPSDPTACPTSLVCKPLQMQRAGVCAAP